MIRSLKIIIPVVLIVLISSSSTYGYISGDHFEKDSYLNLEQSSYVSYVNPFNNSTSTPFVLNFSLNSYPGGPLWFNPCFRVNSSVTNLSEVNHIMNLTASSKNGVLSSPYWSAFTMQILISPSKNNPEYDNFDYYQGGTGSSGVGYNVILWSQYSGDNNSIFMAPITIPSGNYNVTIMVVFHAVQPSQTYLNLTNGRAWVRLTSLGIYTKTTLYGVLKVSNLDVSTENW